MDLETWLSSFLEGKKLNMALTRCEDAMIESLADLVKLYESEGKAELKTVFPKMLAVIIDEALVKLADDGGLESLTTEDAKDKEATPKKLESTASDLQDEGSESNAIPSEVKTTVSVLPPSFKYHYFGQILMIIDRRSYFCNNHLRLAQEIAQPTRGFTGDHRDDNKGPPCQQRLHRVLRHRSEIHRLLCSVDR